MCKNTLHDAKEKKYKESFQVLRLLFFFGKAFYIFVLVSILNSFLFCVNFVFWANPPKVCFKCVAILDFEQKRKRMNGYSIILTLYLDLTGNSIYREAQFINE